ncbi:ATP-binding protein [Synechococcus sp. PCC 7336]|uniref:sensor histidine kinase n=1 Tax=Synechococcus sp. PCC 7336 TaxID=195250 RepID=UPI00034D4F2F|nr:ATP-binding protein [Synechococcus sp. PCC 7336]
MTSRKEQSPTCSTSIYRIASRIRQSLELQDILDATVAEMRDFLKTDRVKIYRFDPDGSGQVIAESLSGKRLPSLKGLHFPAGDIPPQARELFCKTRVRTIVDLAAQEILLSEPDRLPSTATDELTVEEVWNQPLGDLLKRPVDPCHVEYLSLMGVQSSVVIPLLNGNRLWGLLISHHSKPRAFDLQTLQVLQFIADQVEIAIAQAKLLLQARDRASREISVNQLTSLLHAPKDRQTILTDALGQIAGSVDATGGLLQIASVSGDFDFYSFGQQPTLTQTEWVEFLENTCSTPDLLVASDLDRESSLRPYRDSFRETNLRSVAIVPLQYGSEALGALAVFRQGIDTKTLWAGRQNEDERQDRPRQSFEEWCELKHDRAHSWSQADVDLLRSLSDRLSTAVMQERLYRCEYEQRLLLEMRNRELSLARSAAEEASQLKSDFLSSTSHELRTPLALTLNYLKLLKEGFYDSEAELQEYIQVAYQSTEDLVSSIDTVLDISKIEAGRMQVNLAPAHLPSLLEKKLAIFRLDSDRRGVDLSIDCQVKTVIADELKLRQVLTNLLSNAFKFTRAGAVRVTAIQTASNEATISVSDTGIGIDASKQALVFEAFVQEEGSIRRRFGGTGLGLTICKRLVELMGGKIWLDSPGRGQGTTVSFTIPRVDEDLEEPSAKG